MSGNSSHHSKTARRRRVGYAFGYVIWVAIMFLVAQLLVVALFWLLAQFGVPLDAMAPAAVRTLEAFLAFTFAFALTVGLPWWVKKKPTTLRELGLTRLPAWTDILLGPVTIVPYFIVSATLLSLAQLLPGFQADQVQDVGFSNLADTTSLMLAFMTLVVLAPIVEEALFRGYLYGKLRRHIGLVSSMLLTSICFAALHLQLNVGLDVFVLSIAMCLLREATGSIWAGVLLHMTKNSIAFYVLFVAPVMIH